MPCVIESCETNQQTMKTIHNEGVRFISFPTTDYTNNQLRKLAKKRLYWWCRTCGVDFTTTLINQLHICSRHFLKGNCAQLWDVHSPDWIPSLYIPHRSAEPAHLSTAQHCEAFNRNEQQIEESIANPLFEPEQPNHSALRTLLIDEIIAYPIGRTYFTLDNETPGISNPASYDPNRNLSKELKKCLTKSSPVGRMVLEPSAPNCPERIFSPNSTVTQLDLSSAPRWETERTVMTLQHSVLELINVLE